VKVLKSQRYLLHVVGTAGSPGAFAGRLDGGKQQPHQGADDGNHHQEFDERETS
jgi:hypothetical protein